ncbi:SPASM domain-containing protein [Streptomyces carpaticus]|uniref:SPASM domain-containing protein n=1 Tax=Streptomyces TaxID=1883 RepID=UPI002209541B|nr:SPASM domain-containing protein [Streptomyces carpaticus]
MAPTIAPHITNIRIDRTRAVIGPNGDVYGCFLSRDMPIGNVRTTGLFDILTGAEWADARTAVLPATNACSPDDSNDCDPANTEACAPAYDDVAALPGPALLGGVAS